MKNRIFPQRLIVLAAYSALLLWLSLSAAPPKPPVFFSWDKLQHAGAFALYALLVAWVAADWRHSLRWGAVFAAALFFGAFIEVSQGIFSEVRSAEWGDLAADAIGGGLATLLLFLRQRYKDFNGGSDAQRGDL